MRILRYLLAFLAGAIVAGFVAVMASTSFAVLAGRRWDRAAAGG